MDELLGEFLTETYENIASLDNDIVSLEQDPDNMQLLSHIFRSMHTIKGTCGFIGLPRLEKIAHSGENILGKIRDRELAVSPETVSAVLECLDRIKYILAELESHQKEPEGDDSELIEKLTIVASGASAPITYNAHVQTEDKNEISHIDENSNDLPESDIDEYSSDISKETEADQIESLENMDVSPQAKPAIETPATQKTVNVNQDETASGGDNMANKSIRVGVAVLENLMNMVSEMVLTRNQLMQMLRKVQDSEFEAPLQRLNHITSELQDAVMKTRMQPIGSAWSKLPRLVRDLSRDLGKKIDLKMVGEETELDRQVLELIRDPLTHMVRNSGDHGIERPQDRLAAGKPETGTILLKAYHEGGHINIEIGDDGQGLNTEKIKDKAIRLGLTSEIDAENMSEHEIRQFIFKPGFSTAAQVTNVSGRGVGMDVVRTNIEKIGGTVDLDSTQGKGSRFRIKIPLTLAIVSALILKAGGERFAIPQIGILELVRITPESELRIEVLNNSKILRLRERLLPLISLTDLLKLPAEDNFEQFIIVAQVGSYTFGIIVDQVFETQEIVVKPVAPILSSNPMFSGNTILGDGSVVMILDPNGIASAIGKINMEDIKNNSAETAEALKNGDQMAMLIFKAGDHASKAVPLSLISRLEEIPVKNIEWADDAHVVQYRDRLMPLVTVNNQQKLKETGKQPVLVFANDDQFLGLLVEEIIDIVMTPFDLKIKSHGHGIYGSTVIDGHTIDVIDTDYYIKQAYPDWINMDGVPVSHKKSHPRILLVDDNTFFRNLIMPFLLVDSYDVITVSSMDKGLELLHQGKQFDVIVCDMNLKNGGAFEMILEMQKDDAYKSIPMFALATNASVEDLQKGRDLGIKDIIAKHDRMGLLHSLQQLFLSLKKAVA
jgi:two-component system chemotaxis sensor kinase CheA